MPHHDAGRFLTLPLTQVADELSVAVTLPRDMDGFSTSSMATAEECTLENRASSPYSTICRTPYIQAKPLRRNTVVDVAQLTEPVQRWFTRHRAHSEGEAAPWVPEGVRIRRRKDNQVAACSRLLGLVSTENGYPLPRPMSRRGWLTGEDLLDAWIAEQHGMIQGHVAITRVDSDPATALRWREVTGRPASELAGVSRFFVRSSVRGRGLGSALLETAVDESRARGLIPVAKMVSTSRRGVPLYDRSGWRMVAMYPCGKREDGLETYLYVAPPERHERDARP